MEVSKSGLLSEAAEAFGIAFDFVRLRDFSCVGSADFGARAWGSYCIFFRSFVLFWCVKDDLKIFGILLMIFVIYYPPWTCQYDLIELTID